jgi:hypothetical protein
MEETRLIVRSDRAGSSYRAAVAVELRLAGADYDEIAQELGFANRSGAWKAVQRALRQRSATAVDRYRMTRYAELEDVHRRWWPSAVAGDLAAINRVLAASSERSTLVGSCGLT